MTQDDFEKLVRKYVALETGLDSSLVIPGNDNNPSPSDPYASVLLIDMEQQGTNSIRFDEGAVEGDLDVLINGNHIHKFSVQFYQNGAFEMCKALKVQTPKGQQYLAKEGLTLINTTKARRLDATVSSLWEERAVLELTIGVSDTVTQETQAIREVDFTLNMSAEKDLTTNIEVDNNDT